MRLGGERKELTIFFSDLQGFTSISDGLQLFYKGEFTKAGEIFIQLADDPAAGSYVGKCKEMETAAPKTWDGVWIMTSK